MTDKDLASFAVIVKGIKRGGWTNDFPVWARSLDTAGLLQQYAHEVPNLVRAIQTAEAVIMLAHVRNPGFDERGFLKRCGLLP